MSSLVGLFLVIVLVFAAYLIGTLVGYKDCINTEEKKKGVPHQCRALYNRKF